jgi:hypothetical protein
MPSLPSSIPPRRRGALGLPSTGMLAIDSGSTSSSYVASMAVTIAG